MSGCIYKAENPKPSPLPHHARQNHCHCTGVQDWKGPTGWAEAHWKDDSQGDQSHQSEQYFVVLSLLPLSNNKLG